MVWRVRVAQRSWGSSILDSYTLILALWSDFCSFNAAGKIILLNGKKHLKHIFCKYEFEKNQIQKWNWKMFWSKRGSENNFIFWHFYKIVFYILGFFYIYFYRLILGVVYFLHISCSFLFKLNINATCWPIKMSSRPIEMQLYSSLQRKARPPEVLKM